MSRRQARASDVGRMLLTVAVLGVATAAGTFAQTPTMPRVEFDDAIARAVGQNPTVAEAATAVLRADGLVRQARAGIMPGVNVSVVNTTIDTRIGFEEETFQPRNQFAFRANATVPLLAAAQRAAVAQARDQIGVARLSAAEVRQQVAVSAAQAYLAVIAGRRQVDVDVRSLENARAHLDYAQRRLDGGAGSRLDQLRAAQSTSTAESRLETTRLALRQAQEALGVLLAAAGPVDAGAEPLFETPPPVSEAEWMQMRPDVQFQQAVRQAAERVLADTWKALLPTASASFDPQYITPAGIFQPSRTWRFAVTLTQPVFQGGLVRAARQLREVTLDQSRLALSAIEIRARSEERLAREAVQILESALAGARRAADQSDQVLEITTTAFELGATTNIEVIDAQRSARDAETLATLAEDAVRRAKLDLLVAVGRFPR